MKILRQPYYKTGHGLNLRKRNKDGMATLIFITLLAIMMILVTAEARALFHLHREIKFLEQQQIKRLNTITAHINMDINPVFGLDVRPHPGPLPQERENPFPPLSKPSVWMVEYCANVNNNCHIPINTVTAAPSPVNLPAK